MDMTLQRERCVSHNGQRGTKFQAVILDYGAVLCHEPLPHEIEFIASTFHVAPAEFPALYGSARLAYDRGDISTPEYWAALERQTGVKLAHETLDRLSRVDKEMWSRINTEMTNWLATLRPAGYQTALLSNMQHDMIAHVRANFPWLSDFDHQIFWPKCAPSSRTPLSITIASNCSKSSHARRFSSTTARRT